MGAGYRRNTAAHNFLRIVRGILLKGNGFEEVILQLWQIVLFAVVVLTVGVKRYRKTLD